MPDLTDPPQFANDCGAWERTLEKIEHDRGVPFYLWSGKEFAAAAAYYRNAKHKYENGVEIRAIEFDGTPIPHYANDRS